MSKDKTEQSLAADARTVASQGTREHDNYPDYVFVEHEAWEAAQRLADHVLRPTSDKKEQP